MRRSIAAWLCASACACGSEPSAQPPGDSGGDADAKLDGGGWPDGPGPDAAVDSATTPDASPPDPCPDLTVPTTCFGREVMFRDWGPGAVGDGTYFTDQAPQRLGFTRVQNRMWIVKFRTEDASYHGRISAYGDLSAGVAWISNDVCDAAFGVERKLAVWGATGGGTIAFVVVRPEDEAKLDSDPALASWAKDPRLYADRCYYVAFENVTNVPPDIVSESYIETTGDECGLGGDGTCWYLAMDFGHLLHDLASGQLIAGNVIPGLTQP